MKNGSWREESNKRRGKQEEWGGKWNKDGITKSDTVTNYFVSWCTTLDLKHYPISLSNQNYFKQIRPMIMLAYAQIFSHLGQQVSSQPSYTSHLNGREFYRSYSYFHLFIRSFFQHTLSINSTPGTVLNAGDNKNESDAFSAVWWPHFLPIFLPSFWFGHSFPHAAICFYTFRSSQWVVAPLGIPFP